MHKIDSNGATVDNLFTEGNAEAAVPATVVSSAWLNDVQEEIITPIAQMGITLVKGTRNQLFAAFAELIKRGGLSAPINISPANNQASAADVTGFPTMDTTVILAFSFYYRLYRKTDSQNVAESGHLYATWNQQAATWDLTPITATGDAETEFVLTLTTGTTYKLQYKTSNYSGSSYTSDLRITDIKTIRA